MIRAAVNKSWSSRLPSAISATTACLRGWIASAAGAVATRMKRNPEINTATSHPSGRECGDRSMAKRGRERITAGVTCGGERRCWIPPAGRGERGKQEQVSSDCRSPDRAIQTGLSVVGANRAIRESKMPELTVFRSSGAVRPWIFDRTCHAKIRQWRQKMKSGCVMDGDERMRYGNAYFRLVSGALGTCWRGIGVVGAAGNPVGVSGCPGWETRR